jgi:4-hydroxybenzoate polyprenyltransferase
LLKKLLSTGALMLASTFGLVAIQAAPASAASTVWVGGTATCAWFGTKTLAASRVYVHADSGASNAVGTSGLPYKYGRYDLSLSYIPSGGTWASVTITCPSGSAHPGNHYTRWWLKPDWRNTTGDHSWRNI